MKNLMYTERVNKHALKHILDNKDDFDLGSVYIEGRKTNNGVHTLLRKYYESLNENGETSVKYIQSNKKKFGRYWGSTIGLTSMCKKIRHTIAKDYNIDLDIVNCHPVLLEQICGRYGIECQRIQYYNRHRNELVQGNPDIKQRVLEIINGSASRDDDIKFIDKLYVECSVIRQALKTHYPKIWKYIEKNTTTNVDGVFIANVLQDEENNCLMAMVKSIETKFHYITITSIAYDGFTIERTNESVDLLPELVKSLEHDVLNDTGFTIQLKEKEMTEGYVLDSSNFCSCIFSHRDMNQLLELIRLQSPPDIQHQVSLLLRGCSAKKCLNEFLTTLGIDLDEVSNESGLESCPETNVYMCLKRICGLVPDSDDAWDWESLTAIQKLYKDEIVQSVTESSCVFQAQHDIYDFLEHLRTRVFNSEESLIEYIVDHLHFYTRQVMFPKCYLVNKGQGVVDIEKHIDTHCRYKTRNNHDEKVTIEKTNLKHVLDQNDELFKPLKQFIFHPNEPSTDRVYNTYTGMKATKVDEVDMDRIQPILHHIRTCWANDDTHLYEYILTWLKHAFQFPWIKTEVVLLLFGLEGTGKNILIDNLIIPFIYGEHVSAVSHGLGPVTQRFNSICMNKLFICCNEVSAEGGFHTCFEKLKALITDKTMTIERKGIDIFESYNNFINFIFTTNNIDSVKLGQSDRRYCCIETSPRYKGDYEYFKILAGRCNQETANHFYTYLLNMNSSINIRQIPTTKLKVDMSIHSKNSCELFIDDIKTILEERFDGNAMNDDEKTFDNHFIKGAPKDNRISSSVLYELYKNWCTTNNEKVKSNKEFARCMDRRGYVKKVLKINGKATNGFQL